MRGVLFYTAILGFAFGVFTHSVLPLPQNAILLVLALSFTLGVLWRRSDGGRDSVFFMSGIFLLAMGLGMFRVDFTTWQDSAFVPLEGEDVFLEGVVSREPDVRATTQHLYVTEEQSGELLLVTTDRYADVAYGDVVRFSGTLELPESFETDLGRTFNYPGYLRARGVTHTVSFADVSVIKSGAGNPFLATLLRAKHRFMSALEMAVPEPQAGLGEGLLLGEKRALGDDLEKVFRTTGIIHIVVLSGYNVMLVAEAIMRLLSAVFLPRMRMLIGILAIGSFALMVGLSATVLRASLMAGLVLIARATGRTYAVMRALMIAGLAMVLLNPYLLAYDPGFQLSFVATLGLILLAPYVERMLGLVPTKLQIREFVTATVSTQIMVLPILLFSIGEFSVVSVLVNVLVLPMVPISMALSFVTGVVGLVIPQAALLIGYITHLALSYILAVATAFAALPFASFLVPAFPFWLVVISYVALALLLWHLKLREERAIPLPETKTPPLQETLWKGKEMK